MFKELLRDLPKPHIHLGSFLLRLGLAAIFIYHGQIKLAQGGGMSWHPSLDPNAQLAVAWGETAGGFALLLGLLSRLAALGLIVIQVGAIMTQTGHFGFVYVEFQKNNPARIPTGAEYNFAIITMCLAVIAIGSGKVAVDHLIFGRNQSPDAAPADQPTPANVAAPPAAAITEAKGMS